MGLKVENEVVDSAELISIIVERLGDISQIKANYEVIIMPSSASSGQDLLNSETTDVRNILKDNGIKVEIATKKSHRYQILKSSDIILPTLAIIQETILQVILGIVANIIYDKYIKNTTAPNPTVHFEYIRIDYKSRKLKKIKIDGSAMEVAEILNDQGTLNEADETR